MFSDFSGVEKGCIGSKSVNIYHLVLRDESIRVFEKRKSFETENSENRIVFQNI